VAHSTRLAEALVKRWTADKGEGDVAKLTTNEKEILEELFQMRGGCVLNFSDRTFGEFFRNDMALNIFDPKYNYASGSKANRLRGFWQAADDSLASLSINNLLIYIDTQIAIGKLQSEQFSDTLIQRARSIAARLSGASPDTAADPARKSHLPERAQAAVVDAAALHPLQPGGALPHIAAALCGALFVGKSSVEVQGCGSRAGFLHGSPLVEGSGLFSAGTFISFPHFNSRSSLAGAR
jgi:hypothetical protein